MGSAGTCSGEAAVALAAIASAGVAWSAARVLAAAGGFTAHPLPFTLAPASLLSTHARLTGWGILELYSELPRGDRAGRSLFAALHLARLALAAAGTGIALARLVRLRTAALLDSVLALAIVARRWRSCWPATRPRSGTRPRPGATRCSRTG